MLQRCQRQLLLCWTLFFIASSISMAQNIALENNSPSARTLAVCPEVFKLATAIALSRDVGKTEEETAQYIFNSFQPKNDEEAIIRALVLSIYERPQLSPYEHAIDAETACYQRLTGTQP